MLQRREILGFLRRGSEVPSLLAWKESLLLFAWEKTSLLSCWQRKGDGGLSGFLLWQRNCGSRRVAITSCGGLSASRCWGRTIRADSVSWRKDGFFDWPQAQRQQILSAELKLQSWLAEGHCPLGPWLAGPFQTVLLGLSASGNSAGLMLVLSAHGRLDLGYRTHHYYYHLNDQLFSIHI
ncbi:hypothetical protein Nepgr_003021 [Nepenthes gracilis]|uniref:Uncharacterized protein n=1 Tax=Nepenthes gracilis TaxID=150966 RepID=A0AAD3XCT1_NEPGR|nr:hypothetical protein Nepgr_003021 [Nepenthes gracilis]